MPQSLVPSNQPESLPATTFGAALKFLRKRARLTQDELGRAVGYGREQIARLENGSRLPDLTVLAALFIPALGLQREPVVVAHFLALAGATRQAAEPDEIPVHITVTHTVQQRVAVTETLLEPMPSAALSSGANALSAYRLPAPLLPMLGRQALVDHAVALLGGDARLLTLLGAPGVGKTRLALAIGQQLNSAFAQGACWVPLAAVQDEDAFAGAVADALAIALGPEQTATAAVITHLSTRAVLLVLDNFEHILAAASLVAAWLADAPNLKVLCTSRVALDLYGEYELLVPPLALPDLARLPPLAELAQIPAIALFVARSFATDYMFRLDAENALAVSGLCVALDGLPLAIELAAARSRSLAPQTLLQQLIAARQDYQPTADLLIQSKRNIVARHRTLQEAIAWSYRLLPAPVQPIFAGLGVFWGGCTVAAAQAVTGATAADIEVLLQANLVQSDDQVVEPATDHAPAPQPRLRMLETLRTFATEQLLANAQLMAIQRQHADYFAAYAQVIFDGLRGAEQAIWMQRARRDHDNLRAALRFALQAELGEVAVAIAGGLWWFWNRQGLLNEGSLWLAAALRAPRQSATMTVLQQQQRARALNGAGSMATEQSRFAEAHAYHMEGLSLRYATDDLAGAGDVMHNLGLLARCEGKYAQAIDWFTQAIDLFNGLNGDPALQAIDYANLGITAYEMDDLPLARQSLEEAYTRVLQQPGVWMIAFVAAALAEILREQAEWDRATVLATMALQRYQQVGDAQFLPEPQLVLAKIAYDRGDLVQARVLCEQVLAAYAALEDSQGIANVLQLQAWLLLATGTDNWQQATALAQQAWTLRASVKRALSPREKAERAKLAKALDRT